MRLYRCWGFGDWSWYFFNREEWYLIVGYVGQSLALGAEKNTSLKIDEVRFQNLYLAVFLVQNPNQQVRIFLKLFVVRGVICHLILLPYYA